MYFLSAIRLACEEGGGRAYAYRCLHIILPDAVASSTMNTASRMESTCPRHGCIHMTQDTRDLLGDDGYTGGVDVKGKGRMETYLYDPSQICVQTWIPSMPVPLHESLPSELQHLGQPTRGAASPETRKGAPPPPQAAGSGVRLSPGAVRDGGLAGGGAPQSPGWQKPVLSDILSMVSRNAQKQQQRGGHPDGSCHRSSKALDFLNIIRTVSSK